MRLLRSSPLRDPAGGRTRPDRWDRLARDAGVVSGLAQWHQRLDEAKRARLERLSATLDGADEPPTLGFDREPDEVAARAQEYDALVSFVDRLADATDAGTKRGWRALSRWAAGLLGTYLAAPTAAAWPEAEQRARAAVLGVLDELAALEGTGPPPDVEEFTRILAAELDRPAGRVGRFGHGVFVGRLVDCVGADLDLVVVVGAAEGQFPPRRRDDSLLPERDRRAAGGALRPRGTTSEEEARDIHAVLAAARTAVVTYPAADPRNQRRLQPAPILDEIAGERVVVESFEWWLASGGAPATGTELDVRELLLARAAHHPIGTLPVVDAAALARGLSAAAARASGELSEWSGSVGEWPHLADDLAHPRSPTSLQKWAVCPFSYLLERVLGVRELKDPGEAETINPLDLGVLVHEILEVFFRERLGPRPASGWTGDDHAALLAVADHIEELYRARGLTGRPLLWEAEWRAMRRHLARILDADSHDPRLQQVSPAAVEHGFGFEGDPAAPVEVELDGGRVLRFGGRVDRIDRSDDGRKLVVLDYKTGKADGFAGLDADRPAYDIVSRGRLLQLPIYALAAKARFPDAERVEAYYWFVGRRGAIQMKGGPIDDDALVRFESVVRTIVDGIEHGLFPANPGDDTWRPGRGPTHENCFFCPYDRLCPSNRGEQWVARREKEELKGYVELAEGPLPSEAAVDA